MQIVTAVVGQMTIKAYQAGAGKLVQAGVVQCPTAFRCFVLRTDFLVGRKLVAVLSCSFLSLEVQCVKPDALRSSQRMTQLVLTANTCWV